MSSSLNLSFKMVLIDDNEEILISAWKEALEKRSDLCSDEVSASAKDERSVEHRNRPTGSRILDDGVLIARDLNSPMRASDASQLSTIIRESLDDTLPRKSHIA